jgi:hypothetical protein
MKTTEKKGELWCRRRHDVVHTHGPTNIYTRNVPTVFWVTVLKNTVQVPGSKNVVLFICYRYLDLCTPVPVYTFEGMYHTYMYDVSCMVYPHISYSVINIYNFCLGPSLEQLFTVKIKKKLWRCCVLH